MMKNDNAKFVGKSNIAVQIAKKSTFTFRSRPEIAPVGLQKATYIETINECTEGTNGENQAVTTIHLEAKTKNGTPFVMVKRYNLKGRGAASFLEDYNAGLNKALTEDNLYEEFDGAADNGAPLVLEIGHRKVGKEWEAYIKDFHPAGYQDQSTAEEQVESLTA